MRKLHKLILRGKNDYRDLRVAYKYSRYNPISIFYTEQICCCEGCKHKCFNDIIFICDAEWDEDIAKESTQLAMDAISMVKELMTYV